MIVRSIDIIVKGLEDNFTPKPLFRGVRYQDKMPNSVTLPNITQAFMNHSYLETKRGGNTHEIEILIVDRKEKRG